MRLKRIKLAGFKSFVEPTTIPFPGSMTAVVGPNGCGKSNVIDAVRWVLGESSAKNLRGDAMTDVIFNGSSARKPLGQCSVELIFENASDRLNGEYAKYAELSVKRLVTRDAQSNYFLNGTKCRRRDITDLFLGTGLGPRSYAIIEQGMISRLIESKPQELRVFIEEAAGISKYKERRRETETRIRHTTENLERLADVRGELGLQLEKLERQASAAKRYTELKATERTLKSELAMVRYLALQQKVDELQQALSQTDKEHEALKSQLTGDEAGVEKYRAQQIDIKIQLDKVQDNLLTLTTQITRIEEAKQFKTQRLAQLTEQISQLKTKKTVCDQRIASSAEQFETVDATIEQLAPEIEILEEQYDTAIEHRDDAEEALQVFSQHRRSADGAYHDKKHQAQTAHSQIQSTMSMQMRTQQRIKELHDELVDIDATELQQQSAALRTQQHALHEQKQQIKKDTEQAGVKCKQARSGREKAQQNVNNTTDTVRLISTKLDALNALQISTSQDSSLPPLWQALDVEPAFTYLVEIVLSHYSEPLLVDTSYDQMSVDNDNIPKGKRVMFSHDMVEEKPLGTLAEKIISTKVPKIFTQIHLATSIEQGQQRLTQLQKIRDDKGLNTLNDNHSVLTEDGVWLSATWCCWQASEHATGGLQRQVDINALEQQLLIVSQEQIQSKALLTDVINDEQQASITLNHYEQHLKQTENQLTECTQKLNLVDMQLEQSKERRKKLKIDIEQQKILLEQEYEQLERLSEQVELLDAEIFELETTQHTADDNMQHLQQKVTDTRQNYEFITRKKHALSLTYQQQESVRDALKRDADRLTEQHKDYCDRLKILHNETLALDGDDSDTSEQLNRWLGEKQLNEENKTQLQQQLLEIDEFLRQAQLGQRGLRDAIEQQQKIQQSVLLESEGVKARANILLEQLQETGKNSKDTLAQMPSHATEHEWHAQLEKTQNSITRLGAVNLAAVDEYKIQAERKANLDAQDTDLTTALDTLQSAIRKIDKETKTRFSRTYEQVNTDLKALFPKVFGGGSAYLALTDDDLLETGVTIMARPPGKKNSTIHLLSGGEKALTALSLVFAIFQLNPAPFCLLDEVDAPLDDANVGRFCNLVSQMSQSVQFIYITHNKIAMEMASHLTGVTMAEPGVSRMVAVDVEEAVTLAQA